MRLFILALLSAVVLPVFSKPFIFKKNETIAITISKSESEVVKTALDIFSRDYKTVFNGNINNNRTSPHIYIGTMGMNSSAEKQLKYKQVKSIKGVHEAFILSCMDGKLIVLGSDANGTAYGILELSRLIGVSPWEWWADVTPMPLESLEVKANYYTRQSPSVKYRGIFINDEDWGINPWSYKNYEPSDIVGQMGHKTHERIFELLLRLRANTFWPAMHECTFPFFFTEKNKETAEKYGIYIGTSHCEPMARNTNGEWSKVGVGEYNYLTNRANITDFWKNRVRELTSSNTIYTLGIRGIHDTGMLGAENAEDQKEVLSTVLQDQREILSSVLSKDVRNIPQVLIPYKEILDVYNAGLSVPDDVTLMWCDDNYGYIRHFPNEKERLRKGGNGIYYHISYWGRPHDYLWLATTHPALVYTQMQKVYETGARDMWILNVGDIKPAEYLTEFFLDMAWNIEFVENNKRGLDSYLHNWYKGIFGAKNADEIAPIMSEYYRLAYIRKPEHMGNTRVEENDTKYGVITDLPFSEEEIRERLADYEAIAEKVRKLAKLISKERMDAWFQLVEYPVLASNEMNKKLLYAQLARHGKGSWPQSNDAFDNIVDLTKTYNELNNGKWNFMMDYSPRNLPVFQRIFEDESEEALPKKEKYLQVFNGEEYSSFVGEKPVSHGLGYESKAISLSKGTTIRYEFDLPDEIDSIQIITSLVPIHPIEGGNLCFEISVDDREVQVISFHTEGRSEEWKLNVLRNQAVRKTSHKLGKTKKHTISITAPVDGVIIDQIKIGELK